MSWFKKIVNIKRASIRGEWFINDSGQSTFADGDIGDLNHEAAAIQAKVPEEHEERFGEYIFGGLEELTPEEVEDIGADFVEYMARGGEARTWMVEKEGWIRVHGNNFELQTLDEGTLNSIVDFIYGELEPQEWPTEDIYMAELSTGQTYEINVEQLIESVNSGQALARLKMRRSF